MTRWLRLRTAFRRRQLERDLEDELQFHVAMREERLRKDGVADAPSAARRQFGNVSFAKETCRELWTFAWAEALWQDVRYAIRQLRVNRGFAAVAVFTLSLGIAAATVIYSVCAALVWTSLPYPDPKSLVMVLEAVPGNPHFWAPSSPGDVDDIRKGDTLMAKLASWENGTANVVDAGGEPFRVDQARVTPNFFDVLGVAPELGRVFAPDDAQAGRAREVVLSDRLWRNRFQADPGIPGRNIRIDEQNYTVIGVMPPVFGFPRASKELWTPLAFSPKERHSRNTPRLESVGRLRSGSKLPELQSELNGLALRLQNLYPETNPRRRFVAWPVDRYVVGDYAAQFARLLLGASLFVVLIACLNVANLQLARGTARRRELALRQALGASRRRIIVQLLTESVVLAFGGAAIAILLARFGLQAIRAGMPPELQRYSSGWANLGLNSSVMVFVVALAVLSGILAGLTPALRTSRPHLSESLKEGDHSTAGPGRQRIHSFLLGAEIALSMVLLAGAGLLVHGFRTLLGGSTPTDPASLLTLRIEINGNRRTREQAAEFYREVLERIAALPGVRSATAASALPYSRHARFTAFRIQGAGIQPGAQPTAQLQAVSPDYFQTMHIPLVAGRLLSRRDGPGGPLSCVISEEAARKWWPGEKLPLGERIRLGARDTSGAWVQIVGVVAGTQASVLDRAPRPTVYVPFLQSPESGMDIAVRTSADPLTLAAPVRAAIHSVDAGEPVSDVLTLERMRRNEAIGLTYAAVLMSIFGLIALVLSCAGVYGMTSYLVTRHTHEIGIRMALGASRRIAMRSVFRRCLRPALAGISMGLLLATGLAKVLASVIWGVSATDPSTFTGVPLLLLLAVGLAIYVPARRAATIDPIASLRSE